MKSKILIAAAVMLLSTTTAFAEENMANEMTIVSWGGAYSASQKAAYHDPYSEKTGTKIINDDSANESVAKLRAMAEVGNITWDLVDVEGPDATRLCDEGLAMEVDFDTALAPAPDGTPATKDFGDAIINDCFIPQIVFSTTFGYRTNVAEWKGAVPTQLCDVFDLEKFPGKRALEKRPKKNIEWALLCDGVAPEDLYKVLDSEGGIERALAKLATIKDSTIWWSAAAETPQLLADGEIVIGSTYNGRLFSVIVEQKQPVAMLWDYEIFDYDGWIIPAGLSPERLARTLDYVKFATDTQRLADQAKYIAYGPSRASSQPLVSTHATLGVEMAPFMPTNPENAKRFLVNNLTWWADNQDDAEAKFQAWLAN